MSLGKTLILRAAGLSFVEKMVRRSFLFRPLVTRFIAGDTLEEALEASRKLSDRGLFVTLDYLGENATNKEEALQAVAMYRQILDAIAASPLKDDRLNMSIKLTQCGFDQGDDFAEENYRGVLARAKEAGTFVRVDMESSAYTERTLQMIERVFSDYPNTGTVLQSYLYRSMDDTRRMIALGARVRVVKGAYLEPAEVAHPEKSKVDEVFVEMSKLLMKEGNYPAIATHDEKIIRELKEYAAREGIGKERYEFQMLYGIRRDLQEGLVAEGHRVRVYVPYGDAWYPYFTRRLAERPANSLFILRSLFRR